MKKIFLAMAVVSGLWLLGNLLTYGLQFPIIFRPDRLDREFRFAWEYPFEEVWMRTPREGKIPALWFQPEGTTSPKGVVLYFHGNSGALDRWGHIYEQQFRARGFDVFIPDYRRFGKSRGPVSEEAFFTDALAAYDTLRVRYPSEKIILYGRSMGSGMASYVAAHRPAAHLVLETPFSSMPDLFYTYYPFLPRLFLFRFRLDNRLWVSRVPYPVTVLAGSKDRVVPLRCARRLTVSLKPDDRFVVIDGAGHNNLRNFPAFHKAMDDVFW
ncbi:MAG: alpha/beta fold hydrolase [Saprospiraceae bacterium]|nr:alpha/beta fold hydrolase [Saprospiraceae bacterium]